MRYEFELLSKVPAKKNMLRPVRRKNGKLGLVNDRQASSLLDYIAMQIPPEVRDLGLLHPNIEFTFGVPSEYFTGKANRRWDRDNAITGLLDVFVDMGVLRDDSISCCNGTITIHPAIVDKDWRTHVVLTSR